MSAPPSQPPYHRGRVALFSIGLTLLTGSSLFPVQMARAVEDLTQLSLEDLMEVKITSVAKKAQAVSQTAAAVFVITQEDIRRSGVTSIPEALRMVPGLHVAKVDGNKWAITARGFNGRYSNKLLVLMDGRTVYTPTFSGTYWEIQDTVLEDIDRIEVIRGPGGSLWGANAVNGVINIITKKAGNTQGMLASAVAGTEETITTLRYGGTIGESLSFRVYGKAFARDTAYATTGAHDDWRAARSGFRADWRAGAQDALTFQGDYMQGRAGQRQYLPNLGVPFGTITPVNDAALQSHHALGRWSHQLTTGGETQLQLYFDSYARDEPSFRDHVDTYDLDFQHRLAPIGSHEITWGAGYRLMEDRFQNSTVTQITPHARGISLYSGFLQDEITLVPDQVKLTLGSKILHNDFTGVEIQPSARVLWNVTPSQTLWAALSRAVRTPDRFREDGTLNILQTFSGTRRQLPNPNLAAEKVASVEVGYRGTFGDRVSVDLATFYNSYTDLISSATINSLLSQYANASSGQTYGVELAADWRITDWWTLRPAFTYMQSRLTGPGSSGDGGQGSTPDHQLSIRSRMNLPYQAEFDAWLRWVDHLDSLRASTSDGGGMVSSYTTLDLRLGWRPMPGLTVDVIGQNLLSAYHREYVTQAGGFQNTDVQRAGLIRITWHY